MYAKQEDILHMSATALCFRLLRLFNFLYGSPVPIVPIWYDIDGINYLQ